MKKKSYKNKHNKKRNTAFLYEVLVHEITKCVINKDFKRKKKVLEVFKEFFSKDKILYKERQMYNSLLETDGIDKSLVERILTESQKEYSNLDKKEVFNQQTKLINKVNKELSSRVFSNFVQNYKSLATIAQILNQELPIREKVLLENKFVEDASKPFEKKEGALKPTDGLVYKTFVKNFNDKYKSSLLEEQKEIITRHAISFSDNGLSLKIFLNEEIGRLKKCLRNSLEFDVISQDKEMLQKANEVLSILESYKEKESFDQNMMIQFLEIQSLAKEMEE